MARVARRHALITTSTPTTTCALGHASRAGRGRVKENASSAGGLALATTLAAPSTCIAARRAATRRVTLRRALHLGQLAPTTSTTRCPLGHASRAGKRQAKSTASSAAGHARVSAEAGRRRCAAPTRCIAVRRAGTRHAQPQDARRRVRRGRVGTHTISCRSGVAKHIGEAMAAISWCGDRLGAVSHVQPLGGSRYTAAREPYPAAWNGDRLRAVIHFQSTDGYGKSSASTVHD